VGTLEAPSSNVLVAVRPKEAKADAMKGFIDAHVACGGGGVISRKDVTTKGEGNDDKHQEFGVVQDGLVNNQFAINERHFVLADIIAICGMQGRAVRPGERGACGEPVKQQGSIGIIGVHRKPI
jgi:hypothetical protein